MANEFKGIISLDVRDSKPDWGPHAPPKARDGMPNVLYIVWDDVGFGALDCFGGLIDTPNMKRLADMGLRYTQFHTTALCSPTRSCLLTGRNATSNGMACIVEGATGYPGSNARIPPENALLSEVLVEHGYNTYAVGKWHLTPPDESNVAGSKRLWPLGRGFERYYGFLGGESDQWYPDLTYDNRPVEPPYTPEQGYHLSKDITDKAIEFIRDSKVIAPQKPWFMYFCPGAGHAPHHVWKDWADRYKGKFDMGYEKYRDIVLENQKRMGLIPENVQLPALNPYADAKSADGKSWPELDTVRPWDSLNNDEKRLFARMAEVYAGFVSYTDEQIGRLLDYLEDSGQLDNTIIMAVSDNGASGEGGPNGSVNENKFFNNIPDSIEANMKYLDQLGSPETYNHYPTGWATAFCTPFKMYKRYSGHEGGVADPCIIAWPNGIKARGEIRHQYTHAIDVVPTLYECLGIAPPTEVKGYTQSPIEGLSFKHTFHDASAPTAKQAQFYTMLGTRGVWYRGWHACTVHPALGGWSNFQKDRWELYHLEQDRNQIHNLADQYPEKLEEMKNVWFTLAGLYKGLPLDDRTALEIMLDARPQPSPPRDFYIYYPHCSTVPEAVAVSTHGRSYNISARVSIDVPDAHGVLFAQGSRFGGHTLYIKDRKLHYVYNWLGEFEQKLVATDPVPQGPCTLGVRFRLEGRDGPSPIGEAALYINDELVAQAHIKTQPGAFGLTGGGIKIGRDSGQPASSDYQSPFDFSGGNIKDVIVDVSGERYRDLLKESQAMLVRE